MNCTDTWRKSRAMYDEILGLPVAPSGGGHLRPLRALVVRDNEIRVASCVLAGH